MLALNSFDALLLDIEGTTTPITFVVDVLFPYVKEHLDAFLKDNWHTPEVSQVIASLEEQAILDKQAHGDEVPQPKFRRSTRSKEQRVLKWVAEYVIWQMLHDKQTTPLKQLQGLIWRKGYLSGTLKGKVFEDVKPVLEKFKDLGKFIYIYSSGSVSAQKLLFGFSEEGDMLPLLDGHFDTEIGSKRESKSYIKIAKAIDCKADRILFLTDIREEADAAKSVNMNACLVVRPGNKPIADLNKYETIFDFKSLL